MSRQTTHRRAATLLGIVALVLLVGLGIWAAPRRSVQVVQVDDRGSLTPEQLETLRTVWRGAEPVEGLLPSEKTDARILSPRVTPDGETLYCTVREPGGKADIWRSRLQGRWQQLEPVAELNSDANDIGAAVTFDGQTLFF